MIYKLLPAAEWEKAESLGRYEGSALDRDDGFIHFSGRDQVVQTAALHFTGQTGLAMLTVDEARLGGELRWEASRGGALFPHLYGPLAVDAVVAVAPVPEDLAVADAVAALLG
ncbi:MAG TPA: DUF952 domain-containing protein [Rugosimonospora sp.]